MQSNNPTIAFLVVPLASRDTKLPGPYVELRWNNWDDYGYKTTFGVRLFDGGIYEPSGFRDEDGSIDLGDVKIMNCQLHGGPTEIPNNFTDLPLEYASLGQEISYYEKLQKIDKDLRDAYLKAVRDAVFDQQIEDLASKHEAWEESLLRFGPAVNALKQGRTLLRGDTSRKNLLTFSMDWVRPEGNVLLDFQFDATQELPGRTHVLIGYNGVGKTTLLAELAIAAKQGKAKTNLEDDTPSTLRGPDTTFGAVISVSYSAFDTFPRPKDKTDRHLERGETAWFGYVYCGLRREIEAHPAGAESAAELKSIDEVEAECERALNEASSPWEKSGLVEALEALSQEPSFARAGVDVKDFSNHHSAEVFKAKFKALSTGHKIVLNIVAQLAAHLQSRSLVLLDEPETHLHPPLMAALLRAIHILLDRHDSFAIVATHSPVVVQETPSRNVRMVERFGDHIEVKPAPIETFGENIGHITRSVFSLESNSTDFQGVLKKLASTFKIEEIEELFPNGMSLQARALVRNYQAKK